MAIRGKLRTTNELKEWGIIDNDIRLLCNQAVQTLPYIFFDCYYSTEVRLFYFSSLVFPLLFNLGGREFLGPLVNSVAKTIVRKLAWVYGLLIHGRKGTAGPSRVSIRLLVP